jgi:peptidyl-prolyl cis-trans isomerase D
VMAETQFGYHIINIQDVGAPVKKVKVAIVVNDLTPSNQTYQNIYAEASRFAGTNNTYDKFNRAIEEKGLSKRVASDIQENAKAIPGLENPRPFIRAIFKTGNHKIILDANDQATFELGDRFIIGYVTGIREEGYAPLEQVKADVEIGVVKEKKAQMIVDEINKDRKDARSLVSLAQKMSLNVEQASGISFSSFSVPVAGIEPALIAAAVTVPQNTLSEPIKGNNGVYVINVTAVNEEPATDVAIEKQRLNGSFEARAGYEAYEALKKKANIKDERSKFF